MKSKTFIYDHIVIELALHAQHRTFFFSIEHFFSQFQPWHVTIIAITISLFLFVGWEIQILTHTFMHQKMMWSIEPFGDNYILELRKVSNCHYNCHYKLYYICLLTFSWFFMHISVIYFTKAWRGGQVTHPPHHQVCQLTHILSNQVLNII